MQRNQSMNSNNPNKFTQDKQINCKQQKRHNVIHDEDADDDNKKMQVQEPKQKDQLSTLKIGNTIKKQINQKQIRIKQLIKINCNFQLQIQTIKQLYEKLQQQYKNKQLQQEKNKKQILRYKQQIKQKNQYIEQFKGKYKQFQEISRQTTINLQNKVKQQTQRIKDIENKIAIQDAKLSNIDKNYHKLVQINKTFQQNNNKFIQLNQLLDQCNNLKNQMQSITHTQIKDKIKGDLIQYEQQSKKYSQLFNNFHLEIKSLKGLVNGTALNLRCYLDQVNRCIYNQNLNQLKNKLQGIKNLIEYLEKISK